MQLPSSARMARPAPLVLDNDDVERREIALNGTAAAPSMHSYASSTCYSSSNSTSPAPSLFSKHQRYASSASSLSISPTVATTYTDPFGVSKTHLTDVKEEPHDAETAIHARNFETDYFSDFPQISQEYYESSIPDGLVGLCSIEPLHDVVLRRRQSDTSSMRMSRLSRPYSSTSSLRKVRRASSPPPPPPAYLPHAGAAAPRFSERHAILQRPSISGSFSSVAGGNSLYGSGSRDSAESHEKEVVRDARQRDDEEEDWEHSRTPLLPPIITKLDEPEPLEAISPLPSPSIASTSQFSRTMPHRAMVPQSPLSRRPSEIHTNTMSSSTTHNKPPYSRHHSSGQNSIRRVTPEHPPIAMPESEDEWSMKLGHANFIIHPRPYAPAGNTLEAIEAHFADWQTARSNYAKHLARVSKFYGQTSSIYKLTEEKWASIEDEWRSNHNRCVARRLEFEASSSSVAGCASAGGNRCAVAHGDFDGRNCSGGNNTSAAVLSQFHACKMGGSVKIPKINDSKFPDLGDQDIIGLMTVEKPRSQTAWASQSSPPSETSSSGRRGSQFFHSLMNAFRRRRSR